ncbi:hypothetical protein Tco_0629425 [Tanacetum coccineum]|uniref:HTH myb-type domain-containing protein n=1 Tax=Tanacetum coccineum TaxID=301880 RepID=A0ABQ4WTB5_9ASTR
MMLKKGQWTSEEDQKLVAYIKDMVMEVGLHCLSKLARIVPPRLGPKGYRGNIDKWEKERASEELCTHVHKIPDRRRRNYYLARRVHDKVKGLMLSPEMQVIADQLIEAYTELSNSSEVEEGVDPLIMVKRKYHEREEIMAIVNKKIKEAREEMEADYKEKLATTINEMKSRQQIENPESPLMRKRSCDSASNFDVPDNIQEIKFVM